MIKIRTIRCPIEAGSLTIHCQTYHAVVTDKMKARVGTSSQLQVDISNSRTPTAAKRDLGLQVETRKHDIGGSKAVGEAPRAHHFTKSVVGGQN